LVALPFVDGTFLFAKRSMTGATGNWYCGLDEASEMGFVLHFLRPGDLFIDVGANIGSFTVLAAGCVGADVIAIEPIPATFAHLEMNIKLNGIGELVDAHRVGLSNESRALGFTANLDSTNHVATGGEDDGIIQIEVRTLDQVCGARAPKLIKIDVEGFERSVLMGGQKTLKDPTLACVIMEVNGSGERYGDSDEVLFEIMQANNFRPFSYEPVGRSLNSGTGPGENVIFIRNVGETEARIASARRFSLVTGEV
jgi:FkbM family methyltransferase